MYLLIRSDKVSVPIQWYKFDVDFTVSLSETPDPGPDDLLRVVAHVGLGPLFGRVSVSVHDGAEGVDVYTHEGKLVGLIHADGLEKL